MTRRDLAFGTLAVLVLLAYLVLGNWLVTWLSGHPALP